MALMIGALMMQGIQPGPQVMTEQPELVWGVIASMWTGNLMLLIINLPLVGLWVSMLKVPYRLLFPAIVLFCCIGTYGISNSAFNVWLMLGCAVARLLLHQGRRRARPAAARPRARPAAGGEFPPRHAALGRRPFRLPHPSDQRRAARHRRADASRDAFPALLRKRKEALAE